VLSAQERTVHGQGPDGPRPGVGLGFPAQQPDGPRTRAGRSARTQGAAKVAGDAWSRSREGPPRGGEILGVVLARQADLDSSNRRRVK
jgi:hypothetical protein